MISYLSPKLHDRKQQRKSEKPMQDQPRQLARKEGGDQNGSPK